MKILILSYGNTVAQVGLTTLRDSCARSTYCNKALEAQWHYVARKRLISSLFYRNYLTKVHSQPQKQTRTRSISSPLLATALLHLLRRAIHRPASVAFASNVLGEVVDEKAEAVADMRDSLAAVPALVVRHRLRAHCG